MPDYSKQGSGKSGGREPRNGKQQHGAPQRGKSDKAALLERMKRAVTKKKG